MSFHNVSPRYLDPKAPKQKTPMPGPDRIPRNPQFHDVHARYMDPKQPGGKPSQPPATDPFLDERGHKALAAQVGFANVASRFMEYRTPQDHGIASPREVADARRHDNEHIKTEKGWKSPGREMPQNFTFDSVRRHTEARLHSEKRKKLAATSPVKEYVRHGTPLRTHNPPPHKDDGEEEYYPLWHSGGVSRYNFSDLHRKSLAARAQYSAAEDKVHETTEKLKQAKVSRTHIPRVAKLAPAYQLALQPQFSSSPSRMSAEGDSAKRPKEGGSRSPEPEEGGDSSHQSPPLVDEETREESPPPAASVELRWSLQGKPTL